MTKPALLLIFVLLLAPLWFLVVGSLQDIHGVFVMPPRLVPLQPTIQNYEWVFKQPMARWALNSVGVVFMQVSIAVAISCSGGYAFAFYRFRGKEVLWILCIAAIMVPRMSMLVPRFVVMRKLALSGTFAAAVLPEAYMPIGLLLARAYFTSIPSAILDSARIDGAGELRILVQIVAPVLRPIVTAIGLFSGIGALGNYLWQLLQLQDPKKYTLLVGLMRAVMLRGGDDTNVNPIGRSFAVAVVLVVPLLSIFLIANRYFTSAVQGAVKE